MTETGAHRLYVGEVMHMRLRPFRHQFRYRVFTALLDVDRLEDAASRLLKIDRFGVFSFHRRDHGARDGSPLRPWVERLLADAGRPQPARIMLLSMPRLQVAGRWDAIGSPDRCVWEWGLRRTNHCSW